VPTICSSAMSPDMNPIKHLWDYLGRKVNARTPKCQNIQELGTALLQGWQQYPQYRLRRLIHGIRRRFQELYNQNEAQLMSAGSDHGTFVLLKSHQWHTSQSYSLEKSIPNSKTTSTKRSCAHNMFLC
jgi:hypothetical protein